MEGSRPARRKEREDEEGEKKKQSLTVSICKDFLRGRCSRSHLDCRYAHPLPTVSLDGEAVTVCFDSLRDRCIRGSACRYFHPPPHLRMLLQDAAGIESAPQLGFSPDPIRPSSNRYLVPSRFPGSSLPIPPPLPMKATTRPSIEVGANLGPPWTIDWILFAELVMFAGIMSAEDVQEMPKIVDLPITLQRVAMVNMSLQLAELRAQIRLQILLCVLDLKFALNRLRVCQDYLRGKCERDTCRYLHPPDHLRSRIRDLPVGPTPFIADCYDSVPFNPAYNGFAARAFEQAAKRMRIEERPGDPRRRASPGPFYGGHGTPLFSVSPPLVFQAQNRSFHDQDKLPVCRDFLHNKCSRDMTCRYIHPERHTEVIDNHVTLCRDYLRGKCKRELCRFYHPPSKRAAASRENDGQPSPIVHSVPASEAPVNINPGTVSPSAEGLPA